ncbi:MAG: hypothetical protein ACI8Y7_001076 [Candidatus Woesearchaeota archaeon]|jgi:hypothetical protein
MKKGFLMSILVLALLLGTTQGFADTEQLVLLRADFISQTPDPVVPGEYVELRWRITNDGGRTSDYTFELITDYPFSLDPGVPQIVNSATADGYVDSENGAIIYYKVRVDDNALEGTSNDITLKYYKSDGTGSATLNKQPIRIESQQGLVNIGNVRIEPGQVNLGSVFNISITVNNLGTGFISNAKLSLDTQGTTFSPFGNSNQKTVTKIAGQSSYTYTFEYFADAETEVKVHSIPVTLTYSDSLSRDTNVTTKVGIPVLAAPQYLTNLEQSDSSDVLLPGKNTKNVISISNIGKSDINFVVLEAIETDNYIVTSSKKSYLGNLESDDFETGQFNIYFKPEAHGIVPLQFKIHYRDAYDQIFIEDFTVDARVYTVEEAQQIGLIAKSGNGGKILLLLLIIIGGVIWYRRRKNKKRHAA